MAQDAKMTVIAMAAQSAGRSPAAERMHRHRERRRSGLRCLAVELRETEIDVLIRKGHLKSETRNDPDAVSKALYGLLPVSQTPSLGVMMKPEVVQTDGGGSALHSMNYGLLRRRHPTV